MAGYDGAAYDSFRARDYLEGRYGQATDDERGVVSFNLKSYHGFFQKYASEWDASSARLLEFGGGPAIYPLISAAPFISEATFADYAEPNLKEVQLWRDEDPSAFDWSKYFQHVLVNLEGNNDPNAPSQREDELRSKLRQIIRCDARAEQVLGDATIPHSFDIISCNLCLESVCQNVHEYVDCLKKLRKLLKPNGFLVGISAIGAAWYTYRPNAPEEAQKFYAFPLTEEVITSSLLSAQFKIREKVVFEIPRSGQNKVSSSVARQFTVAQV